MSGLRATARRRIVATDLLVEPVETNFSLKDRIYGSLKHLAKCEVLTKLDLRNCDVEEIDEFLYQRGGLPECQVLFTRGDHSESATSSVANRFEDDETLTDDGYDESPRSDY